MTRKFAAVLSALAVALCFSRVNLWAMSARGGDAHACCRHDAPSKVPTLTDCCVTTAAVGAVKIFRADTPSLPSAVPVLPVPSVAVVVVPDVTAPPGASLYREAVPARAPPLA